MNDESVQGVGGGANGGAPTGLKSAYVLFYGVERGQALEAVVGMGGTGAGKQGGGAHVNGVVNGNGNASGRTAKSVIGAMNGKRKSIEREAEDEKTTPNKRPFIGPVMPARPTSPSPSPSSASASGSKDRQAVALKRKIDAVKAQQQQQQQPVSPSPKAKRKTSNALLAISQDYGDEDEDEGGGDDVGEKVVVNGNGNGKGKEKEQSQSPTTSKSTSASAPPPPAPSSPTPTPTPASAPAQPASAPIPPSSFYGTAPPPPSKGTKRKSPDHDDEHEPPQTPRSAAVNGFDTLSSSSSPRPNGHPRVIGVGGGGDAYERTSGMFGKTGKFNSKKYGGRNKKRRCAV